MLLPQPQTPLATSLPCAAASPSCMASCARGAVEPGGSASRVASATDSCGSSTVLAGPTVDGSGCMAGSGASQAEAGPVRKLNKCCWAKVALTTANLDGYSKMWRTGRQKRGELKKRKSQGRGWSRRRLLQWASTATAAAAASAS
eukprot:349810-Chlamydomonas_euryale.AAC.3